MITPALGGGKSIINFANYLGEVQRSYKVSAQPLSSLSDEFIIAVNCESDMTKAGNVYKIS